MSHDFYGLPTGRIENEFLALDYLLEAGPRLVRLRLQGSDENLFAETPEMAWMTPHGLYSLWGGHRLWHAPEDPVRTYLPDDTGLLVEPFEGGVRLTGAHETPTGMRKQIEVRLERGRAGLLLTHELINEGMWAVEVSAWPVTQLPLGGWAALPLFSTQPGPRSAPDRTLVAWPYTDLRDPRLHLEGGLLLVQVTPGESLKVGGYCPAGWLAYLHHGVLLIKTCEAPKGGQYPDMNCNLEIYANHLHVELESLSPLVRLEPGARLRTVERWEIRSELWENREELPLDPDAAQAAKIFHRIPISDL